MSVTWANKTEVKPCNDCRIQETKWNHAIKSCASTHAQALMQQPATKHTTWFRSRLMPAEERRKTKACFSNWHCTACRGRLSSCAVLMYCHNDLWSVHPGLEVFGDVSVILTRIHTLVLERHHLPGHPYIESATTLFNIVANQVICWDVSPCSSYIRICLHR